MCLQTTWKEPKVAEEDIIVYKTLVPNGDKAKAPIFLFQYDLGKLYLTDMQEKDNQRASTYDRDAGIAKFASSESYISIAEGFHSALNKDRLKIERNEQLYECTIPQGSLYFIGFTGLVASNQIIINRQL